MNSIIDNIRLKQQLAQAPVQTAPPPHRPEMLYIGCVDARLDPIDDIGIPKGKALIYRNVAALVRPASGGGNVEKVEAAGGEIPENVSVGAALEFFIRHIPAPAGGGKKQIVVSGHTDCGGIHACLHGAAKPEDHHLKRYLSALKDACARVLGMSGLSDEQRHRALEEDSVRQSVQNLKTYDVVKKAVEAGQVELHGWVIDTATQRISELSEKGGFVPMSGQVKSRQGYGK